MSRKKKKEEKVCMICGKKGADFSDVIEGLLVCNDCKPLINGDEERLIRIIT